GALQSPLKIAGHSNGTARGLAFSSHLRGDFFFFFSLDLLAFSWRHGGTEKSCSYSVSSLSQW
ncbi:MAG: hypothetical protein JXA90_01565, partial [Planctomycetes bacterium]|nr:hypothetical protein [Planctomycetota bacterium]